MFLSTPIKLVGGSMFLLFFLTLVVATARSISEESEAPQLFDDVSIDLDGELSQVLQSPPQEKAPRPKPPSAKQMKVIKSLETEAFKLKSQNDPKSQEKWKEIIQKHPRNGNAHVQLGFGKIFSSDPQIIMEGCEYLEKAFDSEYVEPVIPMPSSQGASIAMLIGRIRWERSEYELARKFLSMPSQFGGDLCGTLRLATMLDPFPNSTLQADAAVELYIHSAETFLKDHVQPKLEKSTSTMANLSPVQNDPYIDCMLTTSHLSFYHRADVAKMANLQYQISTRVWPALNYESPKFSKSKTVFERKTTAKIKLGIASGVLSPRSSVAADFSGVMQRLDRNKFEITYIFLNEQNLPIHEFVYKHKEDTVLDLRNRPEDFGDGAWITRYHPIIEELDLDILLYLDLTVSTHTHRAAMARLARVQATTHGHPTTSGISTIDYFISWGAAEIETAQDHYTEELILLPKDSMHQYYDRRSNGTHSLIDGGHYEYSAISHSSTFSTIIPSTVGNWYTCMQKPLRFMPEMDELICNILIADPDGQVILQKPDTPILVESFLHRLRIAGCDMSRVTLSPILPHHQLLALFAMSTVILDSYPAGGCAMTRDALELGKVVVTLPSQMLGGRWSSAFYQILGDKVLSDRLITSNLKDYVARAVGLGRSTELREDTEQRIRTALPSLYQRKDSVKAWEDALLKISPVELSINGTCHS